jgi:hypothetical protein
MVNLASGVISTVAGNGTFPPGYAGNGGPATAATLGQPCGIALDSSGNLYVAECTNNHVRVFAAPTPGLNLSVSRANLTVTALSQSKTYGSANPTLTYSTSGFVNGDTASVLGGTPNLTTSATAASGAGTYTITAAAGTLSAANYNFICVNGTLSINPAPLTITANNAAKTYGQTKTYGAGSTAFTSNGLENGDTIGSVTINSSGAPATAGVGSYSITPSAAAGGTFSVGNYSITYANGTLTVNAAPLSVTATSASKTYGAANPAFADTITGFVNGDSSSVVPPRWARSRPAITASRPSSTER